MAGLIGVGIRGLHALRDNLCGYWGCAIYFIGAPVGGCRNRLSNSSAGKSTYLSAVLPGAKPKAHLSRYLFDCLGRI